MSQSVTALCGGKAAPKKLVSFMRLTFTFYAVASSAGSADFLFLNISAEIKVMTSPTGSGSIMVRAALRKGLLSIFFRFCISCIFA
jgi:hypothetical protein